MTFHRLILSVAACGCAFAPGLPAVAPPVLPIVVPAAASPLERTVADELAGYLGRIYPHQPFRVIRQPPSTGRYIWLGSDLQIRSRFRTTPPDHAESFAVGTVTDGPGEVAIIAGADPRGTAHGVYALLTALGCGFYLSGDTLPPTRTEPFSFDGWKLADHPLVRDRIVFNWHNFLSGCSTWNLPDWHQWIEQSQKMGFNGIMVHAYGNNPLVSFTFNGKTKPVGFLSTTAKGRDWSTMHVNDVRRLWGGFIFDGPVFGADAAMVPDDERAASAQRLMHSVFAHAEQRSMDVYLAVDIDTATANPQELISTLPAEARFAVTVPALGWMNQEGGRLWLANPDQPAGYAYYKAQVEALIRAYPHIDCLVAWFRHNETPWMGFKPGEMPLTWQEEFRAQTAQTPGAENLWRAHNYFGVAKVLAAWERALRELGRSDVQLAAGSWLFKFLPGCDRFLPRRIKLIALDYDVLHDRSQLRDAASRAAVRNVAAHRDVVPVAWAHHDDGHYLGRPYTPPADFHSRLEDARASGFGIIHWTTRPLDLFFTSLSAQVWQRSRNQPLRVTCADMAERSFGRPTRDDMGEYLLQWITEAPRFARETSDFFLDRSLTNIDEVVARCRDRLKLIAAVDRTPLTSHQRDRLDFFQGLEEFVIALHQTHGAFQRSQAALRSGDLVTARTAIAECQPGPVIEQFAGFSSLGGITRGEQGLVVSMNLRWLPHILRHRQALGLEPVCYNFAPTSHDHLAQSRGTFTFHFDAERRVWQTLGREETGAAAFRLPADRTLRRDPDLPAVYDEICRTGIESDHPVRFVLRPIMPRTGRGQGAPSALPAGEYRLRLLFADPTSTAAGQRLFDVSVDSSPSYEECRFARVSARFLRLVCNGNSENNWNSLLEIKLGTLGSDGPEPKVTASAAADGYPATHAIDGNWSTRWAARGTNQWIQFSLRPSASLDGIGLAWYRGETRRARFEVQTSQDGTQWTPVRNLHSSPVASVATERVDIFQRAGQLNRAIERTYTIHLGQAGQVDVSLTPLHGKALICGAVLEPVTNAAP